MILVFFVCLFVFYDPLKNEKFRDARQHFYVKSWYSLSIYLVLAFLNFQDKQKCSFLQ